MVGNSDFWLHHAYEWEVTPHFMLSEGSCGFSLCLSAHKSNSETVFCCDNQVHETKQFILKIFLAAS